MKVFAVVDGLHLYGKERANINVAYILRQNGYEVTILRNRLAKKSILDELSPFNSIPVPFPRRLSGPFLVVKAIRAYIATIFKVRKLLKEEHPDYLLIPTEIAIAYLYFAIFDSPVKVVFRTGDSPLVLRKKGIISRLYGLIWRHVLLKRVDINVCISKFISKQMHQSGRVDYGQDTIILNIPPKRQIVKDDVVYKWNGKALRLGYLGRIVPDKGVKELVEATISVLKQHYDVNVFIGGSLDISISYVEMLKKLISQSEYQDRFHLLGNINDIEKFFSNIDVMVVPSIYEEPLSNVINEAKTFHRPSIIFNKGGMPELVQHKETGYICTEITSQSLSKGIIYYARNYELLRIHSENAYQSLFELGLTEKEFQNKWLKVFHS